MFKINGVEVKSPQHYTIEWLPITNAERLADTGEMLIEGITDKLKVTWVYNNLKQSDLSKMLGVTIGGFKENRKIVRTISTLTPYGEFINVEAYFAPNSASIAHYNPKADNIWNSYTLTWVEV